MKSWKIILLITLSMLAVFCIYCAIDSITFLDKYNSATNSAPLSLWGVGIMLSSVTFGASLVGITWVLVSHFKK